MSGDEDGSGGRLEGSCGGAASRKQGKVEVSSLITGFVWRNAADYTSAIVEGSGRVCSGGAAGKPLVNYCCGAVDGEIRDAVGVCRLVGGGCEGAAGRC